jgi:hypothetical protein
VGREERDDDEWILRPIRASSPGRRGVSISVRASPLLHLGGHFAGGQVLHWRAGNALLSGDVVQVVMDRR